MSINMYCKKPIKKVKFHYNTLINICLFYIFNFICILKGFIPIWLKGSHNACYLTTSNVTDALSPAFIIRGMCELDIDLCVCIYIHTHFILLCMCDLYFIILGYDLSSPLYSTWTESVWHEVQIRMFLKQSLRLQVVIFVLGISIFLFSFIIIKKIYAQSEIYFNSQE